MYALTMLLTKRHALFLTINAALIFVNFHIWGYNPDGESRDVTRNKLPRSAYNYENETGHPRSGTDAEQDIDPAPELTAPSGRGYIRKTTGSDRRSRDVISLWRARHRNDSVNVRPTVDVYVTPTEWKSGATESAGLRRSYNVPSIERTYLVDCARLLANDLNEIRKAEQVMSQRPKVPIYEETYQDWLRDCRNFRRMRGYVEVPLTPEEERFPLAFSIAMYRDVESTERLLRAIYRPNNFYCIHIDTKSSLIVHRTVQALAACFDNVWIASHLDKIKWGDVSVLLPEINCMRDLVRYHRKWKYFINLTGQEFPLRTNYELARIAEIFNGSNDIAGSISRMDKDRVNYHWTHRWSKRYQQTIFYNTYLRKGPPPFNLTFFKGELHGLFSRKMVEYIVESDIAKKYLEWCWDTGHPSEHYWNTLNYNTHVAAPGGYIGSLEVADRYSHHPIIRVKNWVGLYSNRTCQGKVVRGICVYGVRDVPWLADRPEMFANKFHLTYQHLGYDCLEELHRNRTKLKDNLPFDTSFYKNIPTVRYSRKDGL
ncbi:hypothetical protein LSH36_144g00002 [Paralvinella palmiformis]|uniref:Beta-1,3-galactosyl-O-glycosyl-glycoprotein beta-1,6-N-acetylglucosaminyltransferase n=1 Tax=Paralvinella palmiformis TaxID=53620 RepID=A0AAD9N7M9_9ANNE|nr:hypothetical protein LSH36_144g00002 [Paralvinella palmiformis]